MRRIPAAAATAEALFQESSAKFQRALAEMRPLRRTERGRQLVADMETRMAAMAARLRGLRRLADAGDPDGATRLLTERITPHYVALGEDAEELTKTCDDLMQQDQRTRPKTSATTRWLMLLLIAGGVVAGGVRGLDDAVDHAGNCAHRHGDARGIAPGGGAAGQVASASQSLAQGTSEQAATLEETSSSATEITAITRKNAENTRRSPD